METREIFERLSKLDPKVIKRKTTKYKDKKTGQEKQFSVSYISARTVMNMLDSIVGPVNWRAEYTLLTETVIACTLYIRLDGEWLGKTDVGTPSDIEPAKGAVSDAFKRAAVHWGIGRELYNEGTANFEDDKLEPPAFVPQPIRAPEPPPMDPEPPEADEPVITHADDEARDDEHDAARESGVDSAVTGDYHPANDTRVLNQETLETFKTWLVENYAAIEGNRGKSGSAILKAVHEAKLITAKEWGAFFKANLTVAEAFGALEVHYAAQVPA